MEHKVNAECCQVKTEDIVERVGLPFFLRKHETLVIALVSQPLEWLPIAMKIHNVFSTCHGIIFRKVRWDTADCILSMVPAYVESPTRVCCINNFVYRTWHKNTHQQVIKNYVLNCLAARIHRSRYLQDSACLPCYCSNVPSLPILNAILS